MPRNSRKSHRGLSLIELLTVVMIIGVLTALLIPALAGARRAAQRTQCASNLRQLTAAMMNYTVEFKGYFPGNVGAIDMKKGPPWVDWLASHPRGIVATYPVSLH